ncbi:MAG: aminopeptidase, partial [Sphingobacteriales bacterium]
MKKIFLLAALCAPLLASAQDNLVKSLDKNSSDSAKAKFKFKEVIALANTSVKNQASSGTCWSYSTNSFLESEMYKAGKKPVELAQIYSARNVYSDKADNYMRMHGAISWGDGGACHDVINMYEKYGAMPQSVYTGLHYGTSKNK